MAKRSRHVLTVKSSLWENMLLVCSCGWDAKHRSPWPALELVEACNGHIREQNRQKDRSRGDGDDEG